MNAPTSIAAAEKSPPVESEVENEISKLVKQKIVVNAPRLIETDAERIQVLSGAVNFEFD